MEINNWLSRKGIKCNESALDLKRECFYRPAYMKYTSSERWESLRRLVFHTGEGKKENTLTAVTSALTTIPESNNSNEVIETSEELLVKALANTFYTSREPPSTLNSKIEQAGDEVLALYCAMYYQQALSCYYGRELVSELKRRDAYNSNLLVSDDDCGMSSDRQNIKLLGITSKNHRNRFTYNKSIITLSCLSELSKTSVDTARLIRLVDMSLEVFPSVLISSSSLNSLHLLDLSHNGICYVPILSAPFLKHLLLHQNNISSLSSIINLKFIPSLRTVTLFCNPIESPVDIIDVARVRRLNYKTLILSLLPKLKRLDRVVLSDNDFHFLTTRKVRTLLASVKEVFYKMSYDGHSQIPLKEMGYSEYRRDSQLSRAPISEMYGHQAHGGVAAGSSYRPPSPGRVSTYPRGSSPTNQISRAPSARIPVTHVVTMSPRKSSPSALPAAPPVAAASQLELPIHSGGGYHSVINSNIRQSSPVRRSPSPSLRDLQAPERRDQYKVIREEFPSAPPSVGIQSGILQPPDAVDVSAWRLRLNQMTAEELRHLIIQQYDRNSSGSIDFCDFLSLWFSQQTFQIRRSSAIATELGKETEPLEVLPKHIYRIREVFNEYEESYLAGIRYGLISAMLKDLMYDQDHEVQHYYGMSTDDMVALIEELAHHRQSRSSGNKEPRYDFAYILQLLFKYISDTEEVALFYDEGCKVFQSLRTKEYGEQPIYQNSTISTKLLVKVLAAPPSFKKMDMTYDDRGYEESLTLP